MSNDIKHSDQSLNMHPWRMAIFPIMSKEYGKFFPMAGLIFLTIFSFTLLRNTKDVLLIGAPGVSEASLPWAKFFLVLPISIIFSMLYVKIKNVFEFEKTYYMILGFFIGFFVLFNFVLYPFSSYLHPSTETITYLQKIMPPMHNFIALFGVWTSSLFYVISELWGTYTLSVLFWQFANDNITTNESKRYYSLLIMAGNIALVTLSMVMDEISRAQDWSSAIFAINILVIACGLGMIGLFRYINKSVLTQERYQNNQVKVKKKKIKLSLTDSLKELSQSKYVLYIALIVLSYGIVINIFETVWKGQLKLFFTVDGVTNQNAMYAFMSRYTFYTGISTIVLNYISKSVLRRKWKVAATVTPLACGFSSILFFVYSMNSAAASSLIASLGIMNAGFFAIMFGASGVVFSKSAKYAFFDPTKEMSFIPLNSSLRTSGKAAVDGVGARLGKSGGGLIQIGLQWIVWLITGTTVKSALPLVPYLTVLLVLLTFIWLFAVFRLSNLYENLIAGNDDSENQGTDKQDTSKAQPAAT